MEEMSNFWGKIGEKLNIFFQWALDNHPGRLIGSLSGFFLALTFILLGLWQTLVLAGLSCLGYYLGGVYDAGETPPWISKWVHRITGKNKR